MLALTPLTFHRPPRSGLPGAAPITGRLRDGGSALAFRPTGSSNRHYMHRATGNVEGASVVADGQGNGAHP
ncbi:MAG TPA: hypothetical protein VFS00_26985 [Polyangiaceae bacterium]|nr:hypothetical protein [Polyangiaceae bacterium]